MKPKAIVMTIAATGVSLRGLFGSTRIPLRFGAPPNIMEFLVVAGIVAERNGVD